MEQLAKKFDTKGLVGSSTGLLSRDLLLNKEEPVNPHQNSQNSVVVVALLMMGFIVVVALIFRPQGAIRFGVGGNGPQVEINDANPKAK